MTITNWDKVLNYGTSDLLHFNAVNQHFKGTSKSTKKDKSFIKRLTEKKSKRLLLING